ncbi:16 kDa phloem protein 2 isoform X2 [Brassica rapa]|uniref:16 kDa phloem protein 2 isoform X2 n=1 Tax=Brassica campestris TaxID=3711 RepID=UPI0004F17B05|nr:16 kDa phloem protein 2 isoform X2 [Brassica rapa]
MPHGTLEVVLVSAKDSMDPYVLLTCRTQDQKSNVASGQGTTPEWNETFIFNVSEGTTELKAKIFDTDVGTEDDPLGEATIPLEAVFLEGDIPPAAYNVVKDEEFKGEIWIALSFKPSENRSRGFEEESYGGWKNSEASY